MSVENIEKSQYKTFGKKSQQVQFPIKNLLAQEDPEKKIWHYNTNKRELLENDFLKWQHSIKRSEGASEYKDKFKGFSYNANDKILEFQIPNDEIQKQANIDIYSPNKQLLNQLKMNQSNKNLDQNNPEQIAKQGLQDPSYFNNYDDFIKQMSENERYVNQQIKKTKTLEQRIDDVKSRKKNLEQQQSKVRVNLETDENEEDEEDKLLRAKQLQIKQQQKTLQKQERKKRSSRAKQRIKKFKDESRWLPNSAFQTYFGKPAMFNYGMGNTNPAIGGVYYGQYLQTHNVNPHRAKNFPQYQQTFANAIKGASKFPPKPFIPRKRQDQFENSNKEIEEQKQTSLIEPQLNTAVLEDYAQLDLHKTGRFSSKPHSPNASMNMGTATQKIEKRRVNMPEGYFSQDGRKLNSSVIDKILSGPLLKGINESESNVNAVLKNQNSNKVPKPKLGAAADDSFVYRMDKNEKSYQPINEEAFNQILGEAGLNMLQKPQKNANVKFQLHEDNIFKTIANKSNIVDIQPKSNLKRVASAKPLKQGQPLQQKENNYFREQSPSRVQTHNRIFPQQPDTTPVVYYPDSTRIKHKQDNLVVNPNKNNFFPSENAVQAQYHNIQKEINEIDDKNPPEKYIFTLRKEELNPRNYKDVNKNYLKRIPYAGISNKPIDLENAKDLIFNTKQN